jgi:hypothetical protein
MGGIYTCRCAALRVFWLPSLVSGRDSNDDMAEALCHKKPTALDEVYPANMYIGALSLLHKVWMSAIGLR